MAAARQPDPDARGDAGLPALHQAADRTRGRGNPGVPRRVGGSDPAGRSGGDYASTRSVDALSMRGWPDAPGARDVPPGVLAAAAGTEETGVARSARAGESARGLIVA